MPRKRRGYFELFSTEAPKKKARAKTRTKDEGPRADPKKVDRAKMRVRMKENSKAMDAAEEAERERVYQERKAIEKEDRKERGKKYA